MCRLTQASSVTSKERLENVTQTIVRLLQGYDIRLRPNFGGEYFLIFQV